MICAVKHCAKPKSRNRYFPFPKDADVCAQWIRFCRRTDMIDTKLEKICAEHFLSSDFERDLPYELGVYSKPRPLKLKPDSVPSVNNIIEFDCYEERKPAANYNDNDNDEDDDDDADNESADEVVQVMVDAEAYLTSLEQENTNLRRQNFKLELAADKDAATIDKLEKQLTTTKDHYNQLLCHLSETFSTAQMQKLQNGKRINWPQQDLRESYELYAISPSAYTMLLRKGYPLPSQRTLQHWDAKERLQQQQQELAECPEFTEGEDEEAEYYELIEVIDLDHNYVNN